MAFRSKRENLRVWGIVLEVAKWAIEMYVYFREEGTTGEDENFHYLIFFINLIYLI